MLFLATPLTPAPAGPPALDGAGEGDAVRRVFSAEDAIERATEIRGLRLSDARDGIVLYDPLRQRRKGMAGEGECPHREAAREP